MRTAIATLVLALALPALAQRPGKLERPRLEKPQIEKREAKAHLGWEHPFGDRNSVPCTHLTAQHPGGDAGPRVPCTHTFVEHPQGHSDMLPCVHLVQEHGGHEARVPCTHGPRNFHRDGDTVNTPCTHMVKQHAGGDRGPVRPCQHVGLRHPEGDSAPNVPCIHVTAQHPNGDEGPLTPCVHPLRPSRVVPKFALNLFVDDKSLQDEVIRMVDVLDRAGIHVGRPRPFNVFHRSPINGDPNDDEDPFWSHYEPDTHSIQLTKGRAIDSLIETIRHEIGHAILGHQCVRISSPGGSHSFSDAKDDGLGMSEGWAQFVGLMLSGDRGAASVNFKGEEWEAGELTSYPFDRRNEFRVGCILWDVFDTRPRVGENDSVEATFADMFRVFSPSLETLQNGPKIPSIDDYLSRLERNGVATRAELKAIRDFNLTQP
ncbi:MAG: hypothetical protein AAB434_08335 [Planctomycetota bacterium]